MFDISRLRRLALRITALQQALDGADFIDCFKLFLQAGRLTMSDTITLAPYFESGFLQRPR